jgi:hypothetical protein
MAKALGEGTLGRVIRGILVGVIEGRVRNELVPRYESDWRSEVAEGIARKAAGDPCIDGSTDLLPASFPIVVSLRFDETDAR